MPAPLPLPLCPECGISAADVSPRKPWWQRRLWIFQLLALLAYLLWFSWMQWRHWPPVPLMTVRGPGIRDVAFPPVRITRADLEALARSEAHPDLEAALFQAFSRYVSHPWVSDDEQLHAALLAPAGDARTQIRWGWPVAWITRTEEGTFTDVYDRTGLAPPQANITPTRWYGHTHVSSRVDPTLGLVYRHVSPWRAASGLVVLVAAWHVGRACSTITSSIMRGLGRKPWNRTRWLPVALTALAIVIIVWRSTVPHSPGGTRLTPTLWPKVANTGLTIGDLRSLRDTPGSSQTIASLILNAAAEAPSTGDRLAVGWITPNSRSTGTTEGLWPAGAYFMHTGVNDFTGSYPAQPWGPTRWSLEYDRFGLSLMRAEAAGPQRFRQYTIQLMYWTWTVLGMFVAWLIPAIPARLALWAFHRRARRRASRGDCVHCGYERVRGAHA